jgi:hypothetical protein
MAVEIRLAALGILRRLSLWLLPDALSFWGEKALATMDIRLVELGKSR